MSKCAIEVANIVRKLPKKYIIPPKTPTERIEYFFDKELTSNPEKLSAQKQTLIIIVMDVVEPLQCVMKSEYINPNDPKLPKTHDLNW